MGECAHALEQSLLVIRAGRSLKAGVASELRPGAASLAQHIAEFDTRLVQEPLEVEISIGAELRNHVAPTIGDLRLDVVQDDGLSFPVHRDGTTGRQERKSVPDLTLES